MEKLAEDKVYLALTRPAIFMGLPLEAAMPVVMVPMLIWAGLHNPFYPAIVFVALYFGARMVAYYDVNAFRLWGLWFQTTYLSKNRRFWGGGSYAPVRLSGAQRKAFGDA